MFRLSRANGQSLVDQSFLRSLAVALSEIDRNLLARCLVRKPRSWEDFVDRFMGLVVHVINHTASSRSIRLTPEDREDLANEVFLGVIRDDFAPLRHFRGDSSLATYLTVIARRIVVAQMAKRKTPLPLNEEFIASAGEGVIRQTHERDEVERLLEELQGTEAQVVRMYHLEGKSYQEISTLVGMPENSVGPTLSRAREKLRKAGVDQV